MFVSILMKRMHERRMMKERESKRQRNEVKMETYHTEEWEAASVYNENPSSHYSKC